MVGESQVFPVQVVDLKTVQDLLRQQANKTTLEVEYTNGEPRITLIFTDRCVEDTERLIMACSAITKGLVEQAYERMGVWKRPTGDDAKPHKDISVA